MLPAVHLLGPILLMLPAAAALESPGQPLPVETAPAADSVGLAARGAPASRPVSGELPVMNGFAEGWSAPTAQQVRIEQRVTIRITPRPAPMPLAEAMFDENRSDEGGPPRFTERKLGKCVPVAGIAGVQPASPDRLLLIMRDQRLVTAQLGKGCRSRDYYSGFLVAKSADGMICTGRDALLSRSGANCQVHTFRQLIPTGN